MSDQQRGDCSDSDGIISLNGEDGFQGKHAILFPAFHWGWIKSKFRAFT